MQIIMLSGKARVGKTWLAKEIADYSFEQGQIPVLLSLADGIKDEAQKLGLTKEEQPKEYREFCQTLGVEKRNQDRDYWVGVLKDKINHHRSLEVKENQKEYDELFEYYLVNEDTKEELLDSLGKWMSVWCGIRNPKEGTDGDVREDCDCTICTARRENLAASKADIIDDFLRILIEKMEDNDEDPPPKGHA